VVFRRLQKLRQNEVAQLSRAPDSATSPWCSCENFPSFGYLQNALKLGVEDYVDGSRKVFRKRQLNAQGALLLDFKVAGRVSAPVAS
jgi:hypothetical protein